MPGRPDDVSLNKAAIMRRCIVRIKEEYAADPQLENFSHIDALTLNVERACQAAIDLAFHIVANEKLGIPQNSSDSFRLLERGGFILPATARSLIAMTGFRNVAVHEYQELDLSILRAVAERHFGIFSIFCAELGIDIS